MNSKVFELKNKLNVLAKFSNINNNLSKNYETLRINQKKHLINVQSVENVLKLCKISSHLLNFEASPQR